MAKDEQFEHNEMRRGRREEKRGGRLSWLVLMLAVVAVFAALQAKRSYVNANEAVTWITDYDEGIKRGEKEDKPILLEFSSNSCPPCQMMKANVFSQDDVGEVINQSFVPVRLNISNMKAEEASMLAGKYNVWATPTFIVLRSNGEIVASKSGYMDKEGFLAWTSEFKDLK